MKKVLPVFTVLLVLFFLGTGLNSQQQIQQPKLKAVPTVLTLMPQIKQIEPLYDDCQLIFYVKGAFFGAAKGNREIRMVSGPFLYKPQITAWSANKIDCLLRGNFELGRRYDVFIFDTAKNKKGSNVYKWRVRTKLKLPPKVYLPGENAAVSGHLMGFQQAGRQLKIGRTNAQITQWTCEDLLFKVPNLPPGKYKMVLRKGRLKLSNVITIKIGRKIGIVRPGKLKKFKKK